MPIGRVLVVDDEPEVGAALRDLLLEIGYLVKNAARGAEALRLVDVFQPDVVLLDLQMPGMPGTEVLAQLRQRHPRLPIIIVTANADAAVALSTLAQGAFDYVVKPFTLEGLERIVGAALGRGQNSGGA
jgi:DNA-binding response OmpR family regulator